MDSVKVTRVEVIGHDGREFSKMLKDSHYEVAIQDDGRTMKLFETEKEDGQGYKHRGASQGDD